MLPVSHQLMKHNEKEVSMYVHPWYLILLLLPEDSDYPYTSSCGSVLQKKITLLV
jgi:hypothetical protein